MALHRHLFQKEDYAQATDGSGRSKTKVVCLEHQIHIGAKLNALSFGHREQAVVVQNVVQCFSPFGINVTIVNAQLCVPAGSLITLWALAVSAPSIFLASWSMRPKRRALAIVIAFVVCSNRPARA